MTSVVRLQPAPRAPAAPHLSDPAIQRRIALTLEWADEAEQAGDYVLRDRMIEAARAEVEAVTQRAAA